MNIKTKLQDEALFLGRNIVFFQTLNKNGIYTVEDYINADIEQISSGSYARKQSRAYQGILKYKYLGDPLVVDVLLDKQYNYNTVSYREIKKDLGILGFGECWVNDTIDKLYDNNGCLKMIDIIDNCHFKSSLTALKDFYINYYNTKIKKEANVETEIVSDKDSLDLLKNELVSLVNERNELDKKISLLAEKINTLEGGKAVNGRK